MTTVYASTARQTAQVTFEDGGVYEGAIGTSLLAFIQQAEAEAQTPPAQRAVAALVDNRLRELLIPVKHDIRVKPLTMQHPDGVRIYRRSLAFLLVAAARECFPEAKVFIDHALPQRAYFCHVEDHPLFSPSDLDQIRAKMQEFIAADMLIERKQMSLEAAREFFQTQGDHAKLRLLRFRTRDYLQVYSLGDFTDYFFGYMAPSTGYLQWFDLELVSNGFLLRYPPEDQPDVITPAAYITKLDVVFQQSSELLRLLDVRDIGQLNEVISEGKVNELVFIAEALHERRIAEIGREIARRHAEGLRLVLISGPSSSGKTTFSKRLAIQIMTHGLKPFTLEMDNYFVDRDKTPLDEKGDYDFEALGAINVALFNEQVAQIISGAAVQLPHFDFQQGRSLPGKTVQLTPEHIVIVEGIHGLNPALTQSIERAWTFQVYISALTQLNIDRYNRISTTDIRLLRRIVRDARHRGWSATDTLARWESVGRGEKLNIFRFQEQADVMFNSALVYELAVLRPHAEPHLLRVNLDHPKWPEANRLLSFLAWVLPTSDEALPDNSILREFVGGSSLIDYHPGAG